MPRILNSGPLELRAIVAAGVLLLVGCAARIVGDVAPEVKLPAYWVVAISCGIAVVLFLGLKTRDITFGVPLFAIGLLLTFTLVHLGQVLGWQQVVSGPWSTWPVYALIATFASPVGAFVDFMVWAGKPRRNSGDSETKAHDGRVGQK